MLTCCAALDTRWVFSDYCQWWTRLKFVSGHGVGGVGRCWDAAVVAIDIRILPSCRAALISLSLFSFRELEDPRI